MKRIVLSLILVAAILATSVMPALAAGSIADLFADAGIPESQNLNVDADIEIKLAGEATYVDGPISVSKKASDAFPAVDLKATVDMSSVRDTFEAYVAGAKVLCGDDDALLAELDGEPIRGEFTVTVSFPATGVVLPDAMINGTDMYGFNDAAKVLFKETDRTYANGELVIDVAIKNPADAAVDSITTKALLDNLDTYLADLTLTCEDVAIDAYGTYKFNGAIEGVVTFGGTAIDNADVITKINYTAVQGGAEADLSATVSVSETSGGGGGGLSSNGVVPPKQDEPTDPTDPSDPSTPVEEGFVDLGNHAWAADAINELADQGIIKGTSATTFAPSFNITRADFSILLVRAFDFGIEEGTEHFTDVNESDYFAKEVAVALEAGIIKKSDRSHVVL